MITIIFFCGSCVKVRRQGHLVITCTYFSVPNSCLNVHLSSLGGVLKYPQVLLSIHVHSPGMTEVNSLFVIYFQLLKY